MFLNRVTGTATIISGAAASAVAIDWTANNSPCKVVRLMGTVPSFAANASAAMYICQGSAVNGTAVPIYAGSSQITAGTINVPVDVDVFPGDTVQVITTATIAAGTNTMAVTAYTEGN
jgi:hypothetical protein